MSIEQSLPQRNTVTAAITTEEYKTQANTLPTCQTFQDLLKVLHESEPQPNPKYWHLIVKHATLIVMEVGYRNQGVVAKDLNIHLPKFNALMPLLREYAYAPLMPVL